MKTTKLKIRYYGDPCLRKKSSPVKEVGPAERMLIASMVETMHLQKGIGLAAPQVGVNQRIFVADIGEGPMAFINPRIIKKSGEAALEEGCLSIPGVNVEVTRPSKILVRFFDFKGKEQEQVFEELLARVILHETDHLDGKMIVDYADRVKKKEIKEQLEEIKNKNNKIPNDK